MKGRMVEMGQRVCRDSTVSLPLLLHYFWAPGAPDQRRCFLMIIEWMSCRGWNLVIKKIRNLNPSADEWIRKLWYIYTMEYYSAIKKNTSPFIWSIFCCLKTRELLWFYCRNNHIFTNLSAAFVKREKKNSFYSPPELYRLTYKLH